MANSTGNSYKKVKIDKSDCLESTFESLHTSESVILFSKFPKICESEPCVLGIDEAGRGPVLGPLVYGVCFCPKSKENDLKVLGCADSKVLTEEKREKIFQILCDEKQSDVGWAVEVISPNTICNSMLKRQKRSLNEVSHDAAIGLIKKSLDAGMNITEAFLDTVGPAEKYQDKLSKIFPQLKVTVESKADATYPIVSAASICAKVIRDFALKTWKFPEGIELADGKSWGSGYPNDPVTKKFLLDNIDQVFGYPQMVRFSWSTAGKILEENAVEIEWEEVDDEADNSRASSSNTMITSFFKRDAALSPHGNKNSNQFSHSFFTDRKLSRTTSFDL